MTDTRQVRYWVEFKEFRTFRGFRHLDYSADLVKLILRFLGDRRGKFRRITAKLSSSLNFFGYYL